MSTTAIFLTNLPMDITAAEIKTQLLNLHPEVFKTPYPNTSIDVQLFHPPNGIPSAVVRGINYNYEKLMLLTRRLTLTHCGWNNRIVSIRWDSGEARTCDGKFFQNLQAGEKREVNERMGLSHRRITDIFKEEFFKSVNTNFGCEENKNGYKCDDRFLCVNSVDLNKDAFYIPGGYNYCRASKCGDSYTYVMYHSTLEQIQAISLLNLNPVLSTNPSHLPQFQSENGKVKATIKAFKGLGANGSIIPIANLSITQGYIPFPEFDPTILNTRYLSKIKSHCWRCKQKYIIVGVNLNLTSLAGVCRCSYDDDGPESAYHWLDNKFTRLIIARACMGSTPATDLVINHYPVKQVYDSAADYQRVMLPLIEEEWFYSSLQFGEDNQITAKVHQIWLIETVNNDTALSYKLYACRFYCPTDNVWGPDNPKCITRATVVWRGSSTVAKVHNMMMNKNGKLEVILRMKLLSSYSPMMKDESIEIIPIPCKGEYLQLRQCLDEWVDDPASSSPLVQILLDPGMPPGTSTRWKIVQSPLLSKDHVGSVVEQFVRSMKMLELRKILNKQQNTAMNRATEYCVSVLQGPPGTGKTFTVATMALMLALQEKGTVLVCAPSNYAADGVTATLNQIMEKMDIPTKVIRIFSSTRARQMLNRDTGLPQHNPFLALHEEIRNSSEWLEDSQVLDMDIIKKHVEEKTEYLLTTDQNIAFEEHECRIKNEILASFDILVCTAGTLGDRRLISDQLKITTIIVDEAGQLRQSSTMQLLKLKPVRIIFAGDQQQLPSTVRSVAASSAGFHLSFMDMLPGVDESWISNGHISYPCTPPWTTLLVQHRMHPDIAEVVSQLSYNGKLINGRSVMDRQLAPHLSVLGKEMQGFRIGVLSHTGIEKKDSCRQSFYNEEEAKSVVNFTKSLLKKGIPASEITIITFYESQRQTIMKMVPEGMDVRNVDAFQGRENSIVIVSFVRSNRSQATDMGFLCNLNRINVALSRAQDFVFIAWNSNFFHKSKLGHMTKLCKLVDRLGIKVNV